jgi:hypothetical protein
MILDMFMSIKIFWPFLDQTFSFVTIADDSNAFPILSYASHPSFWIEITIIVTFGMVAYRDIKKNFR